MKSNSAKRTKRKCFSAEIKTTGKNSANLEQKKKQQPKSSLISPFMTSLFSCACQKNVKCAFFILFLSQFFTLILASMSFFFTIIKFRLHEITFSQALGLWVRDCLTLICVFSALWFIEQINVLIHVNLFSTALSELLENKMTHVHSECLSKKV